MDNGQTTATKAGWLERTFHFKELKTNTKRETVAGLTTFVSMAYILFVNANILGEAGMDKGAVFTATALSAIIGCTLMAFLANYPIGIAPSVVLTMGIPWQTAMAGVVVASVIFTLLSLFKIREIVIDAIPHDLKLAMAAGIGIFIAFVGLKGGGIVVASKSSLVELGSLTVPTTWLTIFGFFVTALLMARRVPGSIFIGILATTLLGLVTGLIPMPDKIVSSIPSLAPTFGVGLANLGNINTPQMLAVIIVLLLVTFFDTAGTLVGLAQQAGLMKNDKMPRIGRALMADSFSMLAGSVMGTTPTAAYVESSAGIAVGGRTGFTSLVIAGMFGLSLFFSPLLSVVTTEVTAPALIIVGSLMAQSMRFINWEKFEIALPAFLTIIAMPLTSNISYGIAFGFLVYPITMIAAGRRKELNPVVIVLFFIFIAMLYVLNILPHN